MREHHHSVNRLVLALESVDALMAPGKVAQRLADDAERDVMPVPFLAAMWLLMAVARHEAAHAHYATQRGWRVLRVVLRADGTGVTTIEGHGSDYDTELHLVVFKLVGLAYDLRQPYSDVIGGCYDITTARLLVDALNTRAIGAPVSFQHVAALAVAFVAEHTRAIENIALALFDARELDQFSVELFGRLR